MERLDGWWAGAVRRGGVDLADLGRRLGGFDALAELDEDGLVAAGLPEEMVDRWRGASMVTKGRALRLCDPAYPPRLREVDEPPPVLFVQGDPAVLSGRAIAVVGTRDCSGLGEMAAHRLSREVAAAGFAIVSGLARGIDAAAHRGALEAGRTIAVLGHGLDHTSPRANVGLRARVAHEGAVVTSFPDALPPDRWTFPIRNRWIAGLAEALVIVEAPVGSGALITVGAFQGLNRPIYVVPGPAGSPSWRGGHDLLRHGEATFLDRAEDLLDALAPDREVPYVEGWLEALFAGATLDEVTRIRGGSTADLLRDLQLRELRGELVRLPGQRYAAAGALV